MKTIKKLRFNEVELDLPFEVELTEEELEEPYYSNSISIYTALIVLKEIKKLKEYVDENFVKKNTIT